MIKERHKSGKKLRCFINNKEHRSFFRVFIIRRKGFSTVFINIHIPFIFINQGKIFFFVIEEKIKKKYKKIRTW